MISNSVYYNFKLGKNGPWRGNISKENGNEDMNCCTPIPFINNIVNSFKNISCIENFDSDEKKRIDLLKSFNVLEEYYNNTSKNIDIDFHQKFLVQKLIDFFVFNDDTEVTARCLQCFCYICQKSFGNLITDLINNEDFLKRLVQSMSFPDDKIRSPSQFTFSQLIKENNFRDKKEIGFWFELASNIENNVYLSTIYYELAKDSRISLSIKTDIIFTSLKTIDMSENAVVIQNSLKTVVNCVKNEMNPFFLTQVQRDFHQFQQNVLQLFDEGPYISVLCKLFNVFVKKGIINIDYIMENMIFDRMINVHLANSDDKMLEKILDFISNLVKRYKIYLEKDFVLKCIGVSFESSFSVRKAAVMLVCELIEIELIDVRYYFDQDFTFFRILVDLIMIPANDVMEALLECFVTLTTLSDAFLNFVVEPSFFDEQERLRCALEEVAMSFADNERVVDLAEDVMFAIEKELPKDQNELYGEDKNDGNVFDDCCVK